MGFISCISFSQEEEFIPVEIEGEEAFISTKTGEYTYRTHADTDPTQLKTTDNGVVYTDISTYKIKKGETLYTIAKNNGISVAEIKKYNKVTKSNLRAGTSIKIVKRMLVKSSSPTISYAGKERIIAKLRPGESPGQFAAPPPIDVIESDIIKVKETKKVSNAPKYKVDANNIKNPVFGLEKAPEDIETVNVENKIEDLLKEVKQEEILEEKPSVIAESKKKKVKSYDSGVEKNSEEKKIILVEEKETVAEKAAKLIAAAKKRKERANVETADVTKAQEIDKESKEKIEDVDKEKDAEVKFHIVKQGESFYGIAKKYNMTAKALMALNNAKTTNLSIGQKLKLETLKK